MQKICSLLLSLSGLSFASPHQLTVGKDGFPTLEAARLQIQTLSKDRPVQVTINPGIYPFHKATQFGPKDGGSAEFPITYRAKGKVIFDGSMPISLDQFAPVNDPKKLSAAALGKVIRIPITDPTIAKTLSNRSPIGALIMQGNDLLHPSRFPNVGFAHATKLIHEDEPTRFQKSPVKGTWEKPNGATFTFLEKPAGSWSQWQQEIETHRRALSYGYLSAQWYRETIPLRSVDPENGHLQFLTESRYGLKHMIEDFQSRHAVFHLLCEIDSPGEWFFDPKEKALYLWPTSPLTKSSRLVVATAHGFLRLKNTQNLHFHGLTVQGVVKGDIVEISGGSNCSINGFTLRNSTATALSISGTSNRAHACDVYDVTRFARLTGGRANEKEITPGKNEISNCHFYLDKLTGVAPTVGLSGTGNLFRNNLMHNLPGQALIFKGNDHLIEQNEFFNIGFEEGDGATLYSGAEFWGYGTRIQHNFIHHIMSTDGLMTRSGIMLDDHDSGREIIENIFYKAGHGSLAINGGSGHKIDGNIFMKGNYGVWIRVIGNVKQRIANLSKFETGELKRGDKHDYLWRCEKVVGQKGWNKSPWTKYPVFAKVMNQPDERRFLPIENKVTNTLGSQMNESRTPDHPKFSPNSGLTYGHPMVPKGALTFENSRTIDPSELFQNPDHLDFRPKKNPPTWLPKIPFQKIGLYLDPSRKSMPDKAQYRKAVSQHFKDRPSCNRSGKYNFDKVNKTIYWNSGALLKAPSHTR